MPNARTLIWLPILLSWAFPAGAAEPVVDWEKLKAETLLHYQSVVRLDTSNPPGNETSVVNYLKSVLDREGIPYQVFAADPKRANLVVRLKGSGRKRPVAVFGHTDTVGVQREVWPVDPFGAIRKDGFIWGRGTTDNKDCVTAGLMLILELHRLHVPLDRDVIYVAEASEESATGATNVGIDYLVKEHWPDIEAEYALAEGGFVHSQNGRVRFVEIAATEKVPRRARLVATGTSGHGSRPRRDNAIVHLSTAVSKIGNWEPPMRLNDVTRTFFERLATISSPEDAARYNGLTDPAKTQAIQDYFALHDLGKYSVLRTSISPTIINGGFRENVIPSHAEAMLDIRALPDEDITAFYAQMDRIIGDPAIKIVPSAPGRPAAPPSRLDSEMFHALEATQRRLYPGAITVPGMVTGATDLAQLRARGVQAYGIGPLFDEAEFAEHGWHSDVERLSEDSLHGLVKFVWYAVTDVAAAK
ncbi:MAG TPA: M20/M25/M40 family metallo-hydrolase [Bryobacteraceae bacterium]|jgi:acetylornithine deacetylase/succinyl-diaminopimelate desuccinylase-like protein